MPCCDTAHFLRPSSCSRSAVWLSEMKMRGSHGVLCDSTLSAGTVGIGLLALRAVEDDISGPANDPGRMPAYMPAAIQSECRSTFCLGHSRNRCDWSPEAVGLAKQRRKKSFLHK